MVRLSRGTIQWTGVIIESTGVILTTSRNLGSAPIADYVGPDGETGQAWVIGRDDAYDIALLGISKATKSYKSLSLSADSTVQIDEELANLSFSDSPSLPLDKRNTRVVGVRQNLKNGESYLQIQVGVQAGAEGGIIIDNYARIRGLRMSQTQMARLGFGAGSEVYALTSASLVSSVVPKLHTGFTNILPENQGLTSGSDPGGPPPIPAIFSGTLTIGGEIPAAPIRLYAKIDKAGLPDLWFSIEVEPNPAGEYVIAIGITNSSYNRSSVSFWTAPDKALETTTYNPGSFPIINLTFP
jgi:hypothetical protein